MTQPKMITGLYWDVKQGISKRPENIIQEVKRSLEVNPRYRDELTVLAGDFKSASILENEGVHIEKVFDDAPDDIKFDTVHKMKHWMVFWALQKYDEVLWIDWDTICLKWPDEKFWSWCREYNTPKFVFINTYWAVVNCSVYYVNKTWKKQFEDSFSLEVSEPNDELMWKNVLPSDVVKREEYWLKDMALNIWAIKDIPNISQNTYFVHIRDFSLHEPILAHFNNINSRGL